MINSHLKTITELRLQFVKFFSCDGGPKRTKTHIKNINGSLNKIILYGRLNYWKLHSLIDTELWPHFFKGDMPTGQLSPSIGVNIAAMKCIRIFCISTSICHLRYLTNSNNPYVFLNEGEGTIIWCNNVLILCGLGNYTLSLRANTWIHNRDKSRSFRPIAHRLKQTIASFKNIVRRDIMRQVMDF